MSYPTARWRLITTPPARGAWNMALDEAILESSWRGEVLPTLRLYDWAPACLSIGYTQNFSDVDLERLHSRGWDVVRRPTGGKAILHTDELTYSVTGPQDEPRLKGGVIESYRRLSEALLEALRLLHLDVSANPQAAAPVPGQVEGPVCFEVPSNYEIVFKQKKLIGSAQARRKEGVLQHGSLPLNGDLARITQGLCFPDEEARTQAALRLNSRAITVAEALNQNISWEEAARAFVQAFSEVLNLELVPDEISPLERERAEELVEKKFANEGWTARF
jgi:lipoyl(octanoyl) transferase